MFTLGKILNGGKFGGERGIRTLDTLLTYTDVPGLRIQPLCHLSKLLRYFHSRFCPIIRVKNVE